VRREQARREVESLWRAYLDGLSTGRRPNMAAFFDRLRRQRPELMRAKGGAADWREIQGWLTEASNPEGC
jgi:hypothetical protein